MYTEEKAREKGVIMNRLVDLMAAIVFFQLGLLGIIAPVIADVIGNAHWLICVFMATIIWPLAILLFMGSTQAWKEFRKQ